ncbi:MAG: hypothetical protein V3T83_09180 [Acidobacteriota bacterium]
MDAPYTLQFDAFWTWLVTHPNCIIRAGTPDSVLYDDDDLHWHFASEANGVLLVQLLRGKRLMAELFVMPERVTYVQVMPAENEEEHTFELICESESERIAAYVFVLAHGYEEESDFTPGRVH